MTEASSSPPKNVCVEAYNAGIDAPLAADATPPDITIDSGPTGIITTDEATFTFSGDPAGDTA